MAAKQQSKPETVWDLTHRQFWVRAGSGYKQVDKRSLSKEARVEGQRNAVDAAVPLRGYSAGIHTIEQARLLITIDESGPNDPHPPGLHTPNGIIHVGFETKIVWLEDPKKYPFVREAEVMTGRRDGSVASHFSKTGKLLGYAELGPKAKWQNDWFFRRMWWTKKADSEDYPGCPGEGVIPTSIKPAQFSTHGKQ